ncbi:MULTISPECIES: hypothetical protein [Marinobacter]|nr:hypothetical protein [Marinobacter sp.]MBO6813094.1 hypothetical protein [Marinobacter sp.]
MNIGNVFESLRQYRQISSALLILSLKGQKANSASESKEVKALLEILNLKVSGSSIFSDKVWHFEEAQEKSAKSISKDRFKFNFDDYPNIPEPIIFELKMVILMVSLLPRSELQRIEKKNTLFKIQSLTSMFKATLRYFDHIFSSLIDAFGADVVSDNFQSLQDLKRTHFVEYSEGFEITSQTATLIERAFGFFHAKRIREYVFAKKLALPRLAQTKAVVSESTKRDRDKVLPGEVFEKVSAISGYVITDFLTKLGVEVTDKTALKMRRNFPFEVEDLGLLDVDWGVIDTYTMNRLLGRGYPYDEALKYLNDVSNLLTKGQQVASMRGALNQRFDARNGSALVQDYLALVYRSALYIIAQYTGMRPSELFEIRLDKPLEESFGVPCIVSHVKKHQEFERSLFDDKWVCIPAMVDALNAAKVISRIRVNPYLLSKDGTTAFGGEPSHYSANGLKTPLKLHFQQIVPEDYEEIEVYPYLLRHTLAYQLFRADLGLPFISHQLKHFGNLVGAFSTASNKGFSVNTLSYGEIGEQLSGSGRARNLRHKAEVDAVRAAFDPDAAYAGVNGEDHKNRMIRVFEGYQASGFTKEEIFEAMAEQGMAIANVGTGMCYGGKTEDFDESLPCIGGLRCNPVRCSNAVVTEAHIPKWREVYVENMRVVESGSEDVSTEHAREAANEARMVLQSLGAF